MTVPAEVVPCIVCAACKHPDGRIVCGPRHLDETMWLQILQIAPPQWDHIKSLAYLPEEAKGWGSLSGQGFIDQFGTFYTREEAWLIADAAGQIIEAERGWQTGRLHSEHLY